jgi:glutathione S-transferase
MAPEIYWVSGSRYSWRVLLAAEIKGIDYGSRLISIAKREHKSPDFLKMNPRGEIPVMKHDDFVPQRWPQGAPESARS